MNSFLIESLKSAAESCQTQGKHVTIDPKTILTLVAEYEELVEEVEEYERHVDQLESQIADQEDEISDLEQQLEEVLSGE